ncbi:MAG TPA: hypothetical protein VM537_34075 [Anaerolineae bacterium]|nr:hypothetical protein [Anaerolineae bacterium]
MAEEQAVYLSYLLRLWSAGSDDQAVWRASLESACTSQREGFASLDDLVGFLRRQTGAYADQTRVRSDEAGDRALRQAQDDAP